MLEEALQSGLEKLRKEQEAYEEAQRIISSDELDDWLVALTTTEILNALGSAGRTALFEKTVTRVTGDVELTHLLPRYFDYQRSWSYIAEGTEILIVDAKNKKAGLKIEGLLHLYSYLEKHAERLEAKTVALQEWRKVLVAGEYACKGWAKREERRALTEANAQWERANLRNQNELKKIEENGEKPMDMQGRIAAFESLGEEVGKILSLYKEAGFVIVYPKPKTEYYAIKTEGKVMCVAEPKAQKILRSALGRYQKEAPLDEFSSTHYMSEFEIAGSALQVKELSIFPDTRENIGNIYYEKQLEKFELESLYRLVRKSNAPLSGIECGSEEIYFDHAILPLRYHVFANGKIKIERLTKRLPDESHAFYALVGLRSLLDMPGFREWFESLSSNHYTKLKG